MAPSCPIVHLFNDDREQIAMSACGRELPGAVHNLMSASLIGRLGDPIEANAPILALDALHIRRLSLVGICEAIARLPNWKPRPIPAWVSSMSSTPRAYFIERSPSSCGRLQQSGRPSPTILRAEYLYGLLGCIGIRKYFTIH